MCKFHFRQLEGRVQFLEQELELKGIKLETKKDPASNENSDQNLDPKQEPEPEDSKNEKSSEISEKISQIDLDRQEVKNLDWI